MRESDLVLAYLALEEDLLTPDQFDRALKKTAGYQKRGHEASVVDVLVAAEFLTPDQVASLETLRKERGRERLVDGYELESILGHGGMGCVYRGRQLSMDRTVALKVLPPVWRGDSDWSARFLREARATARVSSPYIVQGYDAGECRGVHYFAMEFVDGTDLRRLLDERGPLPEVEATRIALSMARALEAIAEAGIVHRDVKPDNILLGARGVAKLADLGLAKPRGSASDLTQFGAIIGTPRYLSPEQARGDEALDVRSDLYSLGITFYQALTGQIPFLHDSPAVLLARRLTEDVPSPRAVRPELSEDVARIVERMTRRELHQRYQDATELAHDLDAHLARASRPAVAPAVVRAARREEPAPAEPAPPRSRLGRAAARSSRFLPFHAPTEEETLFGLIATRSDVLSVADLELALDLQETQIEVGILRPLDRLLVDKGMLTPEHREKILAVQARHSMHQLDDLFGRIAVQLGMATPEDVEAGRREQERLAARGEPSRLGDILVARGHLSPEGKGRILAEQVKKRRTEETRRFGSIALKCGFVDRDRLEEALKVQGRNIKEQRSPTRLGEVLVQLGFLTEEESRAILRAQRRNEMTGRPIRELVAAILQDPAALDYDSKVDGLTVVEPPPRD